MSKSLAEFPFDEKKAEAHLRGIERMEMVSLIQEVVLTCAELVEESKGNVPGAAYTDAFMWSLHKLTVCMMFMEPAGARFKEKKGDVQ